MPLDKSNIHYTAFQMLEKLQATKQMHLLKEIQLNQFNFKLTERKWERDYCTFLTWYAGDAQHTWVTDVEAVQQVVGPRHIMIITFVGSVCSYRSKRDWTSPRAPSAPAPAPVNTHTYHCMNNQHRQCCLPMCLEVCMRVWSITMTLSRESKPKYLV